MLDLVKGNGDDIDDIELIEGGAVKILDEDEEEICLFRLNGDCFDVFTLNLSLDLLFFLFADEINNVLYI